ncbi:MAG: hypothetical protein ACR2N2_03715 [Acidimicrobiia bacterium]
MTCDITKSGRYLRRTTMLACGLAAVTIVLVGVVWSPASPSEAAVVEAQSSEAEPESANNTLFIVAVVVIGSIAVVSMVKSARSAERRNQEHEAWGAELMARSDDQPSPDAKDDEPPE